MGYIWDKKAPGPCGRDVRDISDGDTGKPRVAIRGLGLSAGSDPACWLPFPAAELVSLEASCQGVSRRRKMSTIYNGNYVLTSS